MGAEIEVHELGFDMVLFDSVSRHKPCFSCALWAFFQNLGKNKKGQDGHWTAVKAF